MAHAELPVTAPRNRAAASWAMMVEGLRRFARPVRPRASDRFQLFPSWGMAIAVSCIAASLTLAAMAYVDPVIQRAQYAITGPASLFFEIATDLGKSGWLLIPTGVALLVLLTIMPPWRTFADRVVLAVMARLAFVFIAVAGSGLIITTVKRIIGRGRPRFFEQQGSLYFDFMAWKANYASFPSGHSQTAFAIAVAFACLVPRWRWPLILIATLVAISRVVVDAHYFTDIVWGSAWGAWFTIMTREWFARRGVVFSPTPSRAPFPLPWHRARQAFGQVLARMRRA